MLTPNRQPAAARLLLFHSTIIHTPLNCSFSCPAPPLLPECREAGTTVNHRRKHRYIVACGRTIGPRISKHHCICSAGESGSDAQATVRPRINHLSYRHVGRKQLVPAKLDTRARVNVVLREPLGNGFSLVRHACCCDHDWVTHALARNRAAKLIWRRSATRHGFI